MSENLMDKRVTVVSWIRDEMRWMFHRLEDVFDSIGLWLADMREEQNDEEFDREKALVWAHGEFSAVVRCFRDRLISIDALNLARQFIETKERLESVADEDLDDIKVFDAKKLGYMLSLAAGENHELADEMIALSHKLLSK